MTTGQTQQPGRLDRHVWRSTVRAGAATSRHRIVSALEEALRLAELPGEREGRLYYFRRASLGVIPAQANRRVWMDRMQRSLGELAAAAVHGSDPRAGSCEAVFFDNREQALEALLRRVLCPGARTEWFHAAVLGDAPDAGAAVSACRVVERLRQPDLPPAAAAAIIVASLRHTDPARLLDQLPPALVRGWSEDPKDPAGAPEAPPVLPGGPLHTMLVSAARQFGWLESRTVWLAALVVMTLAPRPLSWAHALAGARSILRALALREPAAVPMRRNADKAGGAAAQGPAFDAAAAHPAQRAPRAAAREALPDAGPRTRAGPDPGAAGRSAEPGPEGASIGDAVDAHGAALLGEPTTAAGLYFLLHVLRHLGIAAALEASPELASAGFVARLLTGLAAQAGVSEGDPILACVGGDAAEFPPGAPCAGAPVWPKDWRAPTGMPADGPACLRVWSLAVRRWCRRHAKMTVRELVTRHGRVWLTRADLDVTLPLSLVDVRIRRIGLDLDPGWVPWLGRYGRVVRFHYRDRWPREGTP